MTPYFNLSLTTLTLTGVATLKIAENLPEDGQVVSLDIDETFVGIGRPFFKEAK